MLGALEIHRVLLVGLINDVFQLGRDLGIIFVSLRSSVKISGSILFALAVFGLLSLGVSRSALRHAHLLIFLLFFPALLAYFLLILHFFLDFLGR